MQQYLVQVNKHRVLVNDFDDAKTYAQLMIYELCEELSLHLKSEVGCSLNKDNRILIENSYQFTICVQPIDTIALTPKAIKVEMIEKQKDPILEVK